MFSHLRTTEDSRTLRGPVRLLAQLAAAFCLMAGVAARAQNPAVSVESSGGTAGTPAAIPAGGGLEERLKALEAEADRQRRQIGALTETNRQLLESLGKQRATPTPTPSEADEQGLEELLSYWLEEQPPVPMAPETPLPATDPGAGMIQTTPGNPFHSLMDSGNQGFAPYLSTGPTTPFLTGLYDKGFVLVAPKDKHATPFAMKFNVTTQLRYTGFARSKDSWTDSTGLVLPVTNQSNFEIDRNWFTFSGYAFDPRMVYNIVVFSTSTTNQSIALGAISYAFDPAFTLSMGYYKVPGTREWIESARYPLGADRTMANTFFRPSVSPGLFANGELVKGLYYIGGIYNAWNAVYEGATRVNTNMVYSGNVWWEPLGSFGPGYADEEYHETLAARTGTSLTVGRSGMEPNLQLNMTNPENTILRLTDGTPLYQPGALGAGSQLQNANVQLLSYDLSFKYRGLSLSGEYYGRWINGMRYSGTPIPPSNLNLFDTGGLAQGSWAVVPRRLELFARTSGVFGKAGTGTEYGGGINWYALGTRNVRGTLEVKNILNGPANNPLYGYAAGQSGTLFQVQLLTDF